MRNIKDYLIESGEFEALSRDFKWTANSKYFYFNPSEEVYGFATEQDIKRMVDDEVLESSDAETILHLNVGEIYSPDNGQNQYVKIKK